MKVLFVDDSADYLRSVENLFGSFKFKEEVVCFVDAFEALNYISKNYGEISGVFTDYQMNSFGVSGEIIASKCEELRLPVYICTGHDNLITQRKCTVIPKTQLERLVDTLRELCNEGAA